MLRSPSGLVPSTAMPPGTATRRSPATSVGNPSGLAVISSHEASNDWSTCVAHSWRTGRAAVDAVCVACTTPTMRYPSGVAGTSGRTTGVRSVEPLSLVSPVDRALSGAELSVSTLAPTTTAAMPATATGTIHQRRVRRGVLAASDGDGAIAVDDARDAGSNGRASSAGSTSMISGRPRLAMDGAPPASRCGRADRTPPRERRQQEREHSTLPVAHGGGARLVSTRPCRLLTSAAMS